MLVFVIMFAVYALWRFILSRRKVKKIDNLEIYFGVPGSGKTTLAAAMYKFYSSRYSVYSNVPILGAYQLDLTEIGKVKLENCVLLIDEASIDYNNRLAVSRRKDIAMDQDAIKWFKLHRHACAKVIIFSQSYNDMDITLRRLCDRMYIVRKSLIPFFITTVKIRRSITIDENTHEPCDDYRFDHPLLRLFTNKRYFAPRYWKLFDSWAMPELPEKIWKTY